MKKAIKNSVGILLLALALVVTQIPTTEVAAETSVASDFQMNGDTLVKYVGTAKTVSVPAKVKKIGEEAFAGNTSMQEITFKGNVESIAYRAFAGCSELKKVTLPDTVTEIGNGAFSNCLALKEVTFGKNLKKIGMGVFAGCENLEKITVPKENENFTAADGCLYDKDKTVLYFMIPVREKDTYSMPSSVTDIAEYAFWGCSSIRALSLSSNLKTIPAYAFSNCKSLQSLAVPHSVTGIELMAFADCVNLETVSIPAGVGVIHKTAFDGCPRLKIIADIGTAAYRYYEEWKETHDQAEYEDTGNNGQAPEEEEPGKEDDSKPDGGEGNTGADSRAVLGSTYVVGNRAVVFIDNSLPEVFGAPAAGTDQDTGQTDKDAGTGISGGNADAPSLTDQVNTKDVSIPKYTVAGTVIADQAFYMSSDMTGYSLPEGVTGIGEFAFARSSLSRIEIPEGVVSIDYGAFYHCDSLRDVEIPSTVREIAPKAFEKSLWLENWLAGGLEDYLIVGDGILLAYRGAGGDIVLPDKVRQIAPEVFKDNLTITGVTLPDTLTGIGEGAFQGCRNLTGVKGGRYVVSIGDRAFAGCQTETFHVTEGVKEIGLRAVDYSDTIKSTSAKVVVFDGNNLPVVSYEETAARLSNEEARGPALNDVLFAVIDKSLREADLSGTVLDGRGAGFKGFIAYISSHEKETVEVAATTLTAEELAEVYIPEYIIVDGRNYKVEGTEGITPGSGMGLPEGRGELVVVQDTQSLPEGSKTEAALEGNDGYFLLKISDSESARETLDSAYEAVYGGGLPDGAAVFDMSLKDRETGVEIRKLGSAGLSVKLTLPAGMAGTAVRVVTVDRNGQLENVSSRYDQDGSLILETGHLSPFAVYSVGKRGTGKMDASPDTGEGIHPKWFWAAGLFSTAVLVLFSRSGSKTRRRKGRAY